MAEPHPAAPERSPDPHGLDGTTRKVAVGKGRLWLFRLLAIFLVPALLIGVLEVGLRVSGYGYSSRFFKPSEVEGKRFLIPNFKFGYRFFPPALARIPALFRIPAEKPAGTYRIFLFGESAALGDPDSSYGMGRYLEVLLEARYPETDFEVVCVAMTAIDSHVILPIARECAHLQGDLWVVYMGNNEMIGPFGAGTVFGAKAPPLGFARGVVALKATRVGQLLDHFVRTLRGDSSAPESWNGIDMFGKNQLRYNDANRLRAYDNFEGNLKDMLREGRRAGVPVILGTVASNLRNFSPLASLHSTGLDAQQLQQWDTLFNKGVALEDTGDYGGALSNYLDAAAIDAEYAELHFRIGTCQLALGQEAEARRAFERARDWDALAVRADSRINRIIQDTGRESGGRVVVVDAAKALAEESGEGIPGEEWFYEHVHFTVDGNYRMARLFADQVAQLLPPAIRGNQSQAWLDEKTCNEHLALTEWDQLRLWKMARGRINVSPYTAQSSHPANVDYMNAQIRQGIKRASGVPPQAGQRLYEQAIASRPDDTFLIGNYAQFLEGTGSSEMAIVQAEKFRDLLPGLAWPHCYLGGLLAREGRFDEAKESFLRALEIRPDLDYVRETIEWIDSQNP